MGHWMSPDDLEEKTGLTKNFWAKRRMWGLPPEYAKVGRAIRYWSETIDQFMRERTRISTSDPGRPPDPTPLRPTPIRRRDPDRPGPGRPRRKIDAEV